MKIFAATLIAALAAAQSFNETEVESTLEQTKNDMFELNDEGRLEFRESLQDLPKISFTNYDEDAIVNWASSKMDSYKAIEDEWVSAFESYMEAVRQPWNDLVDRAEALDKKGSELDLKTTTEIMNAVSNNVFVDGSSLDEMFPQIGEAINEMNAFG